MMRSLDEDYVLVLFGGLSGYSRDDINKCLWNLSENIIYILVLLAHSPLLRTQPGIQIKFKRTQIKYKGTEIKYKGTEIKYEGIQIQYKVPHGWGGIEYPLAYASMCRKRRLKGPVICVQRNSALVGRTGVTVLD